MFAESYRTNYMSANEMDGDDTERHKWVKLVMIACHDLAENLLIQHNAETVGKRDPPTRLR